MKKILTIATMVAFAMGLTGVAMPVRAHAATGNAPAEAQSDQKSDEKGDQKSASKAERKHGSNVHVTKSKKGKDGKRKGLTKSKNNSQNTSATQKQSTTSSSSSSSSINKSMLR